MRATIACGIGRREQRAREAARVAVHAREQPAAPFEVVERAAVERVAPHAVARRVHHEEVAGHADAVHRYADAAPDLHHHDRERDRDAEPALEHRVEERVLGIAVVAVVARGSRARSNKIRAQVVERR